MRSVVRAGVLVLVLLALARSSAAQQRWGLALDLGLTRFWGGSEAIPPDETPGLKPYRPTTVAVRVDRVLGRARVGLGVAYGASGIAAESEDLTVIAKGGLGWVQLAPELAYRLATLGSGPELRVFGGPVADLWLPDGEDRRFRLGAHRLRAAGPARRLDRRDGSCTRRRERIFVPRSGRAERVPDDDDAECGRRAGTQAGAMTREIGGSSRGNPRPAELAEAAVGGECRTTVPA